MAKPSEMPKPSEVLRPGVLSKPRVLIVEDDVLISEATRFVLEAMGYDVVSVESTGPDAVKRACLELPDVILMDVTLGGKMDGIEAAGKIRSCSKAPVIFTTGYVDPSRMDFPDKQSFFYLTKPFTPEELLAALKKALSMKGSGRPEL